MEQVTITPGRVQVVIKESSRNANNVKSFEFDVGEEEISTMQTYGSGIMLRDLDSSKGWIFIPWGSISYIAFTPK